MEPKKLLLAFIALFSFSCISAQGNAWQRVDTTDGLTSNEIQSIFIENKNTVWLGTDQGLSELSNGNIVNYNTSNSNIASNNILQIIKTQNSLWIRTDSGVSNFNGSSFINYNAANGLASNNITGMASTSNGDLWLGSSSGITKYDGTQFTIDSNISSTFLAVDRDDNIYSFNYYTLTPNYPFAKIYNGSSWADQYDSNATGFIKDVSTSKNGKIIITVRENYYYEIQQPSSLIKNPLQKPAGILSSGGFDKVRIQKNGSTWAISNLKNLLKGKDSTLYKVPLDLSIINSGNNQLRLKAIKIGEQNIYVGTNKGLLYIDKSANVAEKGMSLNTNQVKTRVFEAFPSFSNNANLPNFEMPKGSGNHGIYTSSFIVAVKESGKNQWIAQPVTPYGRQFNGGPYNPTLGLGKTYLAKVSQAEIATHKQSYHSSNYTMPDGIKNWPAVGDSINSTATNLAPFVDANNNGCYDPGNGDYPVIKGDEAIYWINHSPDANLPFEYHYMLYAYNAAKDTAINQTVFVDFKVINRGQTNYDSVKIGFYADGDLGNPTDDYVGCDSLNNLFYFYNGDNFDEPYQGMPGYGNNPPAVGIKLLSDTMTNFVAFKIGTGVNGDPTTADNWGKLLNSQWKNGQQILYGGNGYNSTGTSSTATNYMYTGDPYLQTGWTEKTNGNGFPNAPGDRRGVAAIPYRSLAPGLSQSLSIAVAYGMKNSVMDASENIDEMLAVLNHAKTVWDTISTPTATYGSNYNCAINVSLEENTRNQVALVKVYPVPSRSFINIESEHFIQHIRLISMEGKLLIERDVHEKHAKLDLSRFPQGIYFLNIQLEDGQWENRKLLLTK